MSSFYIENIELFDSVNNNSFMNQIFSIIEDSSVTGPTGSIGPQGPTGSIGPQGPQGPQGTTNSIAGNLKPSPINNQVKINGNTAEPDFQNSEVGWNSNAYFSNPIPSIFNSRTTAYLSESGIIAIGLSYIISAIKGESISGLLVGISSKDMNVYLIQNGIISPNVLTTFTSNDLFSIEYNAKRNIVQINKNLNNLATLPLDTNRPLFSSVSFYNPGIEKLGDNFRTGDTTSASMTCSPVEAPNGENYGNYIFWDTTIEGGASWNTGGQNFVAIGNNAGTTGQGENAIALGTNAGTNNQGTGAIAIGMNTGVTYQGNNSIAIGTNAGYYGEVYLSGGYEASGYSPIVFSTDLNTWYNSTSSSTIFDYVTGIAYSPKLNIYMAVGSCGKITISGCIAYSYDGELWTPINNSYFYSCSGVYWSDKFQEFIIVGTSLTSYTIAYSKDGKNITGSYSSTDCYCVCSSDSMAIVGTTGLTDYINLLRSTDGTTWQNISLNANVNVNLKTVKGVTWNGKMFVAVGLPNPNQGPNESLATIIIYSGDGNNWNAGTFINGLYFTQGNGITWNEEIGLFVAVGSGGNAPIATSTDGAIWNGISVSNFTGNNIYSSISTSTLIALGSGSYGMLYSTNGMNWNPFITNYLSSGQGGCSSTPNSIQAKNTIIINSSGLNTNATNENTIIINASGYETYSNNSGLYINPIRYFDKNQDAYQALFYDTKTYEILYAGKEVVTAESWWKSLWNTLWENKDEILYWTAWVLTLGALIYVGYSALTPNMYLNIVIGKTVNFFNTAFQGIGEYSNVTSRILKAAKLVDTAKKYQGFLNHSTVVAIQDAYDKVLNWRLVKSLGSVSSYIYASASEIVTKYGNVGGVLSAIASVVGVVVGGITLPLGIGAPILVASLGSLFTVCSVIYRANRPTNIDATNSYGNIVAGSLTAFRSLIANAKHPVFINAMASIVDGDPSPKLLSAYSTYTKLQSFVDSEKLKIIVENILSDFNINMVSSLIDNSHLILGFLATTKIFYSFLITSFGYALYIPNIFIGFIMGGFIRLNPFSGLTTVIGNGINIFSGGSTTIGNSDGSGGGKFLAPQNLKNKKNLKYSKNPNFLNNKIKNYKNII